MWCSLCYTLVTAVCISSGIAVGDCSTGKSSLELLLRALVLPWSPVLYTSNHPSQNLPNLFENFCEEHSFSWVIQTYAPRAQLQDIVKWRLQPTQKPCLYSFLHCIKRYLKALVPGRLSKVCLLAA